MPRALDSDLRMRVINACLVDHLSTCAAAKRFSAGISTAIKWVSLARSGQFFPGKQGRPFGSRLDGHEDFILGILQETNDMTLDEMVTCLRDQRGVKISRSALHHWLRDKGWSFKKNGVRQRARP